MPQITLNRTQAQQIIDVAKQSGSEQFFVAKDHGAYVGQIAFVDGVLKRAVFYFNGCDPQKDGDWYENVDDMFGGDDFGEMLPLSWLTDFIANPRQTKIVIRCNKTSITATAS